MSYSTGAVQLASLRDSLQLNNQPLVENEQLYIIIKIPEPIHYL